METHSEYLKRTKTNVFEELRIIDERRCSKLMSTMTFTPITDETEAAAIANAQRGQHLKFLSNLDEWYNGLDEDALAQFPKGIVINLNVSKDDPYANAKTDSLYGGLLGALKKFDDGRLKREWRLVKRNGKLCIVKL